MLHKTDLLKEFKTRDLTPPGFEDAVTIRELSATEVTELGVLANEDNALVAFTNAMPSVISRGLVRPRLTADEVRKVPARYSEGLQEIFEAILELSGLSNDSEGDAKN